MDIREYHRNPAIGSTDLRRFKRSPAHFVAGRSESSEPTKALVIGDAAHACILEPERFIREYIFVDVDRRTKAGKERAEEIERQGVRILSTDDGAMISAMRDSVMEHPAARRLLESRTDVERSIFWTDTTGIECKARPDVLTPGLCVDLKTCEDASDQAFARSIATYGYALQAAHYMAGCHYDGSEVEDFVFICVEKAPPFAVAVYVIDRDDLISAEHERIGLLGRMAECAASGRYPAYSERIETIGLPAWAKGK